MSVQGRKLGTAPSLEEVTSIASQIGILWADGERRRPTDVLSDLRWPVKVRSLGARAAGIRSLLVPTLEGGFTVIVNSAGPEDRPPLEWLVAHEIGHALFYADGSPPRRILSASAEEETFCDGFADYMTSAHLTFAS